MLCFDYTVGFPLSAPVLSWLFNALGDVANHSQGVDAGRKTPPRHIPKDGRSNASHPTSTTQDPLGPALRANPYPEVTDPFCRLPLSTLLYQLEAAHLGDLMRL